MSGSTSSERHGLINVKKIRERRRERRTKLQNRVKQNTHKTEVNISSHTHRWLWSGREKSGGKLRLLWCSSGM